MLQIDNNWICMCHGLSPFYVCSQRKERNTDNQGVSREKCYRYCSIFFPHVFCITFWFILGYTENLVAHCALVWVLYNLPAIAYSFHYLPETCFTMECGYCNGLLLPISSYTKFNKYISFYALSKRLIWKMFNTS